MCTAVLVMWEAPMTKVRFEPRRFAGVSTPRSRAGSGFSETPKLVVKSLMIDWIKVFSSLDSIGSNFLGRAGLTERDQKGLFLGLWTLAGRL
jgi:hypothetical protein